jgi:hypothetical protein
MVSQTSNPMKTNTPTFRIVSMSPSDTFCLNPPAKYRLNGGTHQGGPVFTKTEVSDDKPRDGIDGPGVKPPVKKSSPTPIPAAKIMVSQVN